MYTTCTIYTFQNLEAISNVTGVNWDALRCSSTSDLCTCVSQLKLTTSAAPIWMMMNKSEVLQCSHWGTFPWSLWFWPSFFLYALLHYYHLHNDKLQHTLPNIITKLDLKIPLLLLGHKFCVIPAHHRNQFRCALESFLYSHSFYTLDEYVNFNKY